MKTKINAIRRAMLSRITKALEAQPRSSDRAAIDPQRVKTILVVRPNHRLGNLILVTPLIQELENLFPKARIDVLAKGMLAEIIFANYRSIRHVLQLPKRPFVHPLSYLFLLCKMRMNRYDLAIDAVRDSSSGRIFTRISRATVKLSGIGMRSDSSKKADDEHIAKHQIYALRRQICC